MMRGVKVGSRHDAWREQWTRFRDDELFLFEDWIAPFELEFFRGKRVLDAGCGGAQHTLFLLPYAEHVTAVDLNTSDLAGERVACYPNVEVIEADITSMSLGVEFDVVMSIGVVHHTEDPEGAVANLKRHLAPNGVLMLWVYSEEGNGFVRHFVEPLRAGILHGLSRSAIEWMAWGLTAAMFPPVHTLYRLPLPFLPYYEYLQNFRRMSFARNALNVFDKLNAPHTDFISRRRAEAFVSDMEQPLIEPYRGVSYRISGRRRNA